MKRMLLVWLVSLSGLSTLHVSGQGHPILSGFKERKEQALRALEAKKEPDTARVNALLNVLATAMVKSQYAELEPFYTEAKKLSLSLNFTEGVVDCYRWKAQHYREMSKIDSSHICFDSAISTAASQKENSYRLSKAVAEAQRRKGLLYVAEENYHAALHRFFESLKFFEPNPAEKTAMVYQNIADVYLKLHNQEQALYYGRKNAEVCEKLNLQNSIKSQAYLALAFNYLSRNQLDMVSLYLDKMRHYVPDTAEVLINSAYYLTRGELLLRKNNCDSAEPYLKEGYRYARMVKHKINITSSLHLLYQCARKQGRMAVAKDYVDEEIKETGQEGSINAKINAKLDLSDYYHATGNGKTAYEYLQQAMALKDSFINENNLVQVNRLAAIYESGRKEQEIIRLENEQTKQQACIRQQSLRNKVYVGAICVLLMMGLLFYRHVKNRQQIQQQLQELQRHRINELEKDKQLLTVDAMLRGQEEERSRIAKDLHDGLGGLLSGVKLSFMNLREKVPVTPEGESGFEHSTRMLDRTITELRKVAHNLMPELLLKYGLEVALEDFCSSIAQSSDLHIAFQSLGVKREINSQAASAVYRIAQELVNNVLKHANAKEIFVQLTIREDKVILTVEDDGQGFTTTDLLTKNGAGISNIQNRVNYFKGMMDINSAPGKGTSVTVELFV